MNGTISALADHVPIYAQTKLIIYSHVLCPRGRDVISARHVSVIRSLVFHQRKSLTPLRRLNLAPRLAYRCDRFVVARRVTHSTELIIIRSKACQRRSTACHSIALVTCRANEQRVIVGVRCMDIGRRRSPSAEHTAAEQKIPPALIDQNEDYQRRSAFGRHDNRPAE